MAGNRVIFEDFVQRFDAGEVDESYIDELLAIVYPDDPDAGAAHKDRVLVDGKPVKFQAVGLNKRAQTAWNQQRLDQVKNPPIEPLPEVAEIPVPVEYENDIPDEVYDHPDYVPQIKQRVGIIQAVRTWGKQQAQIKDNRTEGVKVRCPFSHHVDNTPSAWCNTQKNTWYCGKCQVGGDVIDFYAARKHDLAPDQFHQDKQFARIVGEMADELGILIVSAADGGFAVEADTSTWASNQPDTVVPDEPELPPETATVVEQTEEGPLTVEMLVPGTLPPSEEASEPITLSEDDVMRGLAIEPELPEEEEEKDLPSYEWRDLGIKEGTFLHSWMVQAEQEMPWVPQEFYLGLGFQAIGIAMDHKTVGHTFGPLTGSTVQVYIGITGGGKSTALGRLKRLLQTATGAKRDHALASGVKLIGGVASAEAMVRRFKTEIPDINDPKADPTEVGTNVWYSEDELAVLMSKAGRSGGGHIKQRVMKFHDFYKSDPNRLEEVDDDYSVTNGASRICDTYFTGSFLTQPNSLKRIAEQHDLESGFFNRMTFWAGPARTERVLTNQQSVDPNPDYIKLYERMWKDCQFKYRVIPFSDEALLLADNHPLKPRLQQLHGEHDMYARWQMQVLRFSLLLAVNENEPLVQERHVSAAYQFVLNYIVPCAALMIESVQATERNEVGLIVDKMEEWVGKQYDKTGEWPEFRNAKAQRWWKNANPDDQNKATYLAGQNGTVINVTLLDGPWGSGKRTIAVVPTGDYALYADEQGKTYKYADFYAGRSKR